MFLRDAELFVQTRSPPAARGCEAAAARGVARDFRWMGWTGGENRLWRDGRGDRANAQLLLMEWHSR